MTTLDDELLALSSGASLACLACGGVVVRESEVLRCQACGSTLAQSAQSAQPDDQVDSADSAAHTGGVQLTFDAEASARQRDRAIRRVDRNAEPDWKEAAYLAVVETAAAEPNGFIVDDVWPRISPGIIAPHELRAMGAVMRRAQRDGVIVPTTDYRLSSRVSAHRNPRRVWRSASGGGG